MWKSIWVVLLSVLLAGCGGGFGNAAAEETPPVVQVQVGEDTYDLILGAFCWNYGGQGVCTDTAGYVHLVKFKDFIEVAPGTELEFTFPESTPPHQESLVYSFTDAYEGVSDSIDNHKFKAPDEEGTYYFGYDVKWDGNPGGTVSYAFGIEVKEDTAGE